MKGEWGEGGDGGDGGADGGDGGADGGEGGDGGADGSDGDGGDSLTHYLFLSLSHPLSVSHLGARDKTISKFDFQFLIFKILF